MKNVKLKAVPLRTAKLTPKLSLNISGQKKLGELRRNLRMATREARQLEAVLNRLRK